MQDYDDMMLQANTPHGAVVVRATPDYSVLRYDSVIEGRAPRAADEVEEWMARLNPAG